MKLLLQVCSLQQAKRLKELGIEQKSHFTWYEVSNGDDEGDFNKEGVEWHPVLTQYSRKHHMGYAVHAIHDDLTTSDGAFCSHKEPCSAFTVAELGALLPNGYDTMRTTEGWRAYDIGGSDITPDVTFNTESEARAYMLIFLLENDLVEAIECNIRLVS